MTNDLESDQIFIKGKTKINFVKVVKMWKRGMTKNEIAKSLKISPQLLHHHTERAGIVLTKNVENLKNLKTQILEKKLDLTAVEDIEKGLRANKTDEADHSIRHKYVETVRNIIEPPTTASPTQNEINISVSKTYINTSDQKIVVNTKSAESSKSVDNQLSEQSKKKREAKT